MSRKRENIPFVSNIIITTEGQRFRARRNERATNWYIVKRCGVCDSLFATIESEIGRDNKGKFCSTKCASLSFNVKGELHPFWRGGTDSPEKIKCRQTFQRAVRTGKVNRQNCSVCGLEEAEGHHEDYSKPFIVIWLYRKHHAEYHARKLHSTTT